ncbi:MAG: AI-2E family transporter [Propionibacterium sp.]
MPAFSLGRRNNWRERLARLDDADDTGAAAATSARQRPPAGNDESSLAPRPLRAAAAWSWRLLVIAAVIGVLWWFGGVLSEVVVPLMAALLLTAALAPLNGFLRHHRFPAWAASLVSLFVLVLILAGLLTLVGTQIAVQWQELTQQTVRGLQSFLTWLGTGPLHISHDQVDAWLTQARAKLSTSQDQIAKFAAAAGSGIGRFFTGLAMALFATFFFLKDAPLMSAGLKASVPRATRATLVPGLDAGWQSLVSYVHAAVIVAAVDGVGAGLGALLLGSNLWLAITALTFVCAFIPIVGALLSGAVAVTVTLVTLGPVKAAIMLVVFVGVMELEAHVLQPLLLGRAVSIHPLVVLVGIAVGINLAGIVGGVFAIPIVAFASGVVRSVHSAEQTEEPAPASGDDPPGTGSPGLSQDAAAQALPGSGQTAEQAEQSATRELGSDAPGACGDAPSATP